MLRRERKIDLCSEVFKAAKTPDRIKCNLFDIQTVTLIYNTTRETEVFRLRDKSERQWFNILRDLNLKYKVIRVSKGDRKVRKILININQLYLILFHYYMQDHYKFDGTKLIHIINEGIEETNDLLNFSIIFNKSLTFASLMKECIYLIRNSRFMYYMIVSSLPFNKALLNLIDSGRIKPVGLSNVVFWALDKPSVERCKLTSLYSKFLPITE